MKGALSKENKELKEAFKKSEAFTLYSLRKHREIGYMFLEDEKELWVSVDGIFSLGTRKNNNGEYDIFSIQTDHENDEVNKPVMETVRN